MAPEFRSYGESQPIAKGLTSKTGGLLSKTSLSPFLPRSRKEAQRDIRSLDEPRGEQFIVPRSEVLAANLLDLPLDAVNVLKIKRP